MSSRAPPGLCSGADTSILPLVSCAVAAGGLHSRCLKASASCGAEQPTGSLLREREIAAISTLVFDSGRTRCPSDLSKSAQVQLPKNAEISGDYKFRTKTAEYRALEKNGRRERISDLSARLTVQRFAD